MDEQLPQNVKKAAVLALVAVVVAVVVVVIDLQIKRQILVEAEKAHAALRELRTLTGKGVGDERQGTAGVPGDGSGAGVHSGDGVDDDAAAGADVGAPVGVAEGAQPNGRAGVPGGASRNGRRAGPA